MNLGADLPVKDGSASGACAHVWMNVDVCAREKYRECVYRTKERVGVGVSE